MEFKRSSGILAHPTSFPSKYGIGDLGKGAFDFIDFLEASSQTLWQVLPLNPTSFGDSPYQSFSTFAGNFLLISPDILYKEGFLTSGDLEGIPESDPLKIDYGAVIEYKNRLFKKSYKAFTQNANLKYKKEFEEFCGLNADWLEDYCLFASVKTYFIEKRKNDFETPEYKTYKNSNKKYLTTNEINDYYYGAVWNSWPKELASYKPEAVSEWREKLSDDVAYYKYLQFQFFKQWKTLKEYANNKNIKIIGDIPIFVAMDSADVWSSRELFYLNRSGHPSCVAGVPPDYFSETGQLWGNPLYNWDKHKKTGYSWWARRVSHTLALVDFVRIDHFRGFESYWSIPYGSESAVNGKWVKGPGSDVFVKMEKQLGDLPIIAEDLGIITEEVTALRESLNFPGMKVLQFGFDAGKNNWNMPHNFITSNTVVYTGTHDNDTTCGWYENISPKIQDQFRRYMNVSGDNCSWDMIRLAFLSVGVFAVAPIQDIFSLGSSHRMNIPGIAGGNWKFRYTEDMLTDGLAERLSYLSSLSDRNVIETEEIEELEEELEEITEEIEKLEEKIDGKCTEKAIKG